MRTLLLILSICIMNPVVSQNNTNVKTLVVAHRGGSLLAPENTLAAFKNALSLGVDQIELDVHLSKDNVVVVIHDETLKRTTSGTGSVDAYSYDEFSQFDAGYKFSEKYKGEKIPSLEQVLELVDGKAKLLIEIKKSGDKNQDIEKAVVDLIQKHHAGSWCIVQSFSYESIEKVHKLDASITLGLLFVKPPSEKIEHGKIDISFISEINFCHVFAGKRTVEFFHKLNKKVFVWTVNKPEQMQRLINHDVDGIITDNPAELIKIINNFSQ